MLERGGPRVVGAAFTLAGLALIWATRYELVGGMLVAFAVGWAARGELDARIALRAIERVRARFGELSLDRDRRFGLVLGMLDSVEAILNRYGESVVKERCVSCGLPVVGDYCPAPCDTDLRDSNNRVPTSLR